MKVIRPSPQLRRICCDRKSGWEGSNHTVYTTYTVCTMCTVYTVYTVCTIYTVYSRVLITAPKPLITTAAPSLICSEARKKRKQSAEKLQIPVKSHLNISTFFGQYSSNVCRLLKPFNMFRFRFLDNFHHFYFYV